MISDGLELELHPLPNALVELIARRFRAIGEPMRVKLLDRLRGRRGDRPRAHRAQPGIAAERVESASGCSTTRASFRVSKAGNQVFYRVVDQGVFRAL